ATASDVVPVAAKKFGGLDIVFPDSLARFIAPTSPELVRDIIVKGDFSRLPHSPLAKDVATRQQLRQIVSCDGPKAIYTPSPVEVIAYGTIEDFLTPYNISLPRAGLRAIWKPGQVASASPKLTLN